MNFEDLKVGRVYSSKKPKVVGMFSRVYDDRQIVYISSSRSVVDHIDHGYTEDFKEWVSKHTLRFLTSESDQIKFEVETERQAKNIETIWDYMVQYDSPTVKLGKKRPIIPAEKFLKWADKDITDLMPANLDWRCEEKQ